MALTFQCIPDSKIDGYIMDSVLVCPNGYKSVIAEQSFDFLEFNPEHFDLGFYGVLGLFVTGLIFGAVVSLIRKMR